MRYEPIVYFLSQQLRYASVAYMRSAELVAGLPIDLTAEQQTTDLQGGVRLRVTASVIAPKDFDVVWPLTERVVSRRGTEIGPLVTTVLRIARGRARRFAEVRELCDLATSMMKRDVGFAGRLMDEERRSGRTIHYRAMTQAQRHAWLDWLRDEDRRLCMQSGQQGGSDDSNKRGAPGTADALSWKGVHGHGVH